VILREARRYWRSSPLLSLSAVAVLALGIGACALTLALLLAFSSLTYPGMRQMGYATIAEETEGGGSVPITWKRFEELASSGRNTRLAAYSRLINTTADIGGSNRVLKVAAVSSGFFSVFTPQLSAGRDFSWVEEDRSGTHVIIVSDSLATGLFKSPEKALERFVVINGLSYKVVGVAPADFRGMFGDSVEAWVPANSVIPLALPVTPELAALLKPDSWKTIATFYGIAGSGRASSTELVADLSRSLPLRAVGESPLHVSQGLSADPVRDAKLRKWLRLGLLLALFFTVVSSLNYSLLLLARTPRYVEEVRLKKALGAGSGRLMTELMIGPAAMVGAGLVAASLFCGGGLMLISRVPGFYGQLVRGSWEAAFLAFGVEVAVACGLTLVIAFIPALSLLRDDGAPQLGHTSTATRRTGFLLQASVTLQIAFCIGTWILASMIISSVTSLMRKNLGYDPSHLTVVSIGPGPGGVSFTVGSDQSFPTTSAIESLVEQVTSVPGVHSASVVSNAPFDEGMGSLTLQRIDSPSATPRTVSEMMLTPGSFQTMGARIIRGADFSGGNLSGNVNEILINETLAKELWPKENPVGDSVRLIHPEFAGMPSFSSAATIVGVVEDMRFSGFTESPGPTVFSSLAGGNVTPYVIVNGSESIHSLEDVASRQVPALIPGLRVLSVYRVGDRARASLWPEKKRAYVALTCALAMAIVAGIGLYGALSYYVGTRRRELAVRVCLGASPWAIRKIILERAAWCAVSAVVLSVPTWPVLARLSSSEYLGRVSWSTGHAVFISLACISLAVLTSLVPASAGARVSPAEVLKEQ
jgi:putative ABC transport system permease protein